ncbi:hypothetical protein FGO68_gene1718 [Halteria grandinella]|uniref:Cryptochrome DASH n=1 Tax=Halteria grandinella TaxID=5974 RepID=A0A8J8NTS5_HALGN|nr:hypothetical protein FGO68_gene1718 [Halteria grandinella]
MHRIIVWLRNDLRVHDNSALNWAINKGIKGTTKQIIPVYTFDPRFMRNKVEKYGIYKCGLTRARFLQESVQNLRANLQDLGSQLLVTQELPEVFLPKLILKGQQNSIVFSQEVCYEEARIEQSVATEIKRNSKVHIERVWGSTIHHIDDLQMDPENVASSVYTKFRQNTERDIVRDCLPTSKLGQLPFIEGDVPKAIQDAMRFAPSLMDLGFSEEEANTPKDPRSSLEFVGGEDAGLERVKYYLWETKMIQKYKDTRNALMGADFSSKLSPWMACGNLSPRYVYWETKKFEQRFKENDSTRHFISELFWRDFCHWYAYCHGNGIFYEYGPLDKKGVPQWRVDQSVIQRWRQGLTGMPLVDALMREMNQSGFMSNRGRQIVASYFSLDLKQDWRYGAHHFEEKLIDHDVHSNYASWNMIAGIGPGKTNLFNVVKQSYDFDADGEFIRTWVPELRNVPTDYIHEPWKMPFKLQQQCETVLGTNYPNPIPSRYTTKPSHQSGGSGLGYVKDY